MRSQGHLEWQYLSTKFNENLPIGSKVISEGHAERQDSDLKRPLLFFESRLKPTVEQSSPNKFEPQ
jgi:hypothetical protein